MWFSGEWSFGRHRSRAFGNESSSNTALQCEMFHFFDTSFEASVANVTSLVYREWSRKEKISSEQQLCGRKCRVDVRGQRRMGRLVRDDRKAAVTQITTRYKQGMQNTISERTTRQTLKQMGYSSRRPHRVPLLSAKNRKRRLQFAQAH